MVMISISVSVLQAFSFGSAGRTGGHRSEGARAQGHARHPTAFLPGPHVHMFVSVLQEGQLVIDPKVLKHKAMHAILPRSFLARMLSNLKGIYASRHDAAATLAIVQYLRQAPPRLFSRVLAGAKCPC